jgi:hypothetical protein
MSQVALEKWQALGDQAKLNYKKLLELNLDFNMQGLEDYVLRPSTAQAQF